MSRTLLVVHWKDHSHRSGWHDAEDWPIKDFVIKTIGYKIKETKDCIQLSSSIIGDDAIYSQFIMKKLIVSSYELEIID